MYVTPFYLLSSLQFIFYLFIVDRLILLLRLLSVSDIMILIIFIISSISGSCYCRRVERNIIVVITLIIAFSFFFSVALFSLRVSSDLAKRSYMQLENTRCFGLVMLFLFDWNYCLYHVCTYYYYSCVLHMKCISDSSIV